MAIADQQTAAEPKPCAPCRGTGQLISNLGGEPSTVTCPWCEGGGMQLAGHDAQAARRESALAAAS
jgi:DnaJ-class molecular chaperone